MAAWESLAHSSCFDSFLNPGLVLQLANKPVLGQIQARAREASGSQRLDQQGWDPTVAGKWRLVPDRF